MKRIVIATGIVSLILGFSSCGLPAVGVEYAVHGIRKATRSKSPDPESKWNNNGWWRRISDDPPSYIPTNYSATAPRTKASGTWLVDRRDGKRLFVPTGDDYMKVDARSITTTNEGIGPIRFEGQSGGANFWDVFPPIGPL